MLLYFEGRVAWPQDQKNKEWGHWSWYGFKAPSSSRIQLLIYSPKGSEPMAQRIDGKATCFDFKFGWIYWFSVISENFSSILSLTSFKKLKETTCSPLTSFFRPMIIWSIMLHSLAVLTISEETLLWKTIPTFDFPFPIFRIPLLSSIVFFFGKTKPFSFWMMSLLISTVLGFKGELEVGVPELENQLASFILWPLGSIASSSMYSGILPRVWSDWSIRETMSPDLKARLFDQNRKLSFERKEQAIEWKQRNSGRVPQLKRKKKA